jgi:hypothetical protein
MFRIAMLLVWIGGGFWALTTFANSGGVWARQTHGFLVAQLAPIGAMVDVARNASYRGPGAHGGSSFDIIANADKMDGSLLACLQSSGSDVSDTAAKFLSMRDHKAIASVAACYIADHRSRYCEALGKEQLGAMMDLYLSARQRFLHPPSGQSARDFSAVINNTEIIDPDELKWDGADDHAVFAALKGLAREGYISLGDFGWFPRAEIRQALEGVEAEGAPCLTQASAQP